MQLETVRIVSDNPAHEGFIEINKTDFDKSVHKLYKGEGPKPAAQPAVTTAEAQANSAEAGGNASGTAPASGWGQNPAPASGWGQNPAPAADGAQAGAQADAGTPPAADASPPAPAAGAETKPKAK